MGYFKCFDNPWKRLKKLSFKDDALNFYFATFNFRIHFKALKQSFVVEFVFLPAFKKNLKKIYQTIIKLLKLGKAIWKHKAKPSVSPSNT